MTHHLLQPAKQAFRFSKNVTEDLDHANREFRSALSTQCIEIATISMVGTLNRKLILITSFLLAISAAFFRDAIAAPPDEPTRPAEANAPAKVEEKRDTKNDTTAPPDQSNMVAYHGRVVDEEGKPIAGAELRGYVLPDKSFGRQLVKSLVQARSARWPQRIRWQLFIFGALLL